jgi:hypothetical protein
VSTILVGGRARAANDYLSAKIRHSYQDNCFTPISMEKQVKNQAALFPTLRLVSKQPLLPQ